MKKVYFLLISFLPFCYTSFCQEDISKVISNYTPSKSEFISRGRNLLLDEFLANNINRVEEIFLYLNNEIEDENYRTFYYNERIILSCWTENYDSALKEILYIDETEPHKFSTAYGNRYYNEKINPPEDIFWNEILRRVNLSKDSIYNNIKNSALTFEEKEVLILTVMKLIEGNTAQEELNKRGKDFLNNYPDSEYAHFVRHYVRYEFKRSNWKGIFGASAGYQSFVGSAERSFSNAFMLGFNGEMYYKNVGLLLGLNATLGYKTKKDIFFNDHILWSQKSEATSSNWDIALGYRVINRSHISVVPFAGLGGYVFSPREKDIKNFPELEKQNVKTLSYVFGLKVDYELDNSFSLGVRFSYSTPWKREIQGDILSITFSFGEIFFNDWKLVY